MLSNKRKRGDDDTNETSLQTNPFSPNPENKEEEKKDEINVEHNNEEDDEDDDVEDDRYRYCTLPKREPTKELQDKKRKRVDKERTARSLSQRIYYVFHEFDAEHNRFKFIIQGCTSSYNLVFHQHKTTEKATCSCPDFRDRDVTCKHLCFVYYKLLGFEIGDYYPDFTDVWNQLETFHHKKQIQPNPENKQHNSSSSSSSSSTDSNSNKQPETPKFRNTECGICCDEFTEQDIVKICTTSCNNACHMDCYKRWSQKNKNCIYCRAAF